MITFNRFVIAALCAVIPTISLFAQFGVRELMPDGHGRIDRDQWERQHVPVPGVTPSWQPDGIDGAQYQPLDVWSAPQQWRNLGPFYSTDMAGSGRTSAIAINPKNTKSMVMATASGGLWQSFTGGESWLPITDALPTTGVSDVVYDPQDTATIYVATGDSWRWTYTSHGIYRTTDAGKTWSRWAALFPKPINDGGGFYGIRSISINPSDVSNVVAVTNNGIYATTDAGKTWKLSFQGMWFDALDRHPTDHRILFAGNGDGNASNGMFFRSTDKGLTWTRIDSGMTGRKGFRTYIRASPADPSLVYALVHDDWVPAYVYTSRDTGLHWTFVKDTSIYFNVFAVDPLEPNTIYGSSYEHWVSRDGGKHWDTLNTVKTVHCDHWCTRWDADGAIYDCNDGGVWRRRKGDSVWQNLNRTICAFEYYDMHNAQRDTVHIMTGSQDNTGQYRSSPEPAGWKHGIFHGDAMMCAVDHDNPDIVYSEGIGGSLFKTTDECERWDWCAPKYKREGNWYTPFVMDRDRPERMYIGYQELWFTQDKALTWVKLTDSIGTGENIDRIAITPANRNAIVVSQGGRCSRSDDQGKTWKRLTSLDTVITKPQSSISDVEVRPNDDRDIVVVFEGFGSGGRVFRSQNAGASFVDITANLPKPLSYHSVALASDPLHTIYVGSRTDVYVRNDTMNTWALFDRGLPNTLVMDLELLEQFGKLRACTWGRGIWETDVWDGRLVTVAEQLKNTTPDVWYDRSSGRLVVRDSQARVWTRVELVTMLGQTIATSALDQQIQLSRGAYVVRLASDQGQVLSTSVLVW
ncbi:MAG: hypothetical protein FGM32_01210 [Candidatus Kapabacteria bacterium]|nr:hypothetical protein [Candidatus Kapabacteria bacterium]